MSGNYVLVCKTIFAGERFVDLKCVQCGASRVVIAPLSESNKQVAFKHTCSCGGKMEAQG
jgi:hypothetical protein